MMALIIGPWDTMEVRNESITIVITGTTTYPREEDASGRIRTCELLREPILSRSLLASQSHSRCGKVVLRSRVIFRDKYSPDCNHIAREIQGETAKPFAVKEPFFSSRREGHV